MSCFGDCMKASAPGNEKSLTNFLNKINKTKSLNNSKKQALVKILENPPANYKKNTLIRIANILKPYATNNQNISKLLVPYMNKPNNTRRIANRVILNPLTVVNNTRRKNGIAFGKRYNASLPPTIHHPPSRPGLPPRPLRPGAVAKAQNYFEGDEDDLTPAEMARRMLKQAGV
jgi:hypothetical protein